MPAGVRNPLASDCISNTFHDEVGDHAPRRVENRGRRLDTNYTYILQYSSSGGGSSMYYPLLHPTGALSDSLVNARGYHQNHRLLADATI